MTSIKMNHKTTTTTLVILAAVAATLLAAGTVAVASNHSAFAWKDKDKKYNKDESYNKVYDKPSTVSSTCAVQSIDQENTQTQSSTIVTAGANSPVTNSGNNAATATNTNNGGNAAAC
jgi:hypothetical protein